MNAGHRTLIGVAMVLAITAQLFAGGDAEAGAVDGDVYRFSFATGPWDVGQGRIDVAEQPNHPWFQYVESQVGAAPLTQSWEWEGSDGYLQGLRLALAGGEPMEVLMPWSPVFSQELIDAGLVVPLDDLIPQYEHIAAFYPDEIWDSIRTQQGGRIYYIPEPVAPLAGRAGFIRRDWLERVGLDVPTTREELLTVYRAFRDQDANGNGDRNDEIPVSGRQLFRWFDDLFLMHGVVMFEGHPQWSWNEAEGFFESHQVSDQMLAAVQFINLLYSEGLMDIAMPAQPNADWTAKIADDRVGHYFHLISEIDSKSAFAFEPENDATGLRHWTVLPHPPIVEGVGRVPYYYPNVGSPRFLITTNARDPEAIMAWLDWSSSPEGSAFANLGVPGVDWQRDADGEIQVINQVPAVNFKYAFNLGPTPNDIVARSPMGVLKVEILETVVPAFAPTPNMLMPASVYDGYADFVPSSATMYREMIGQMITGAVAPTQENWDAYRRRWYQAGGQVVTDRATQWYREFFGR